MLDHIKIILQYLLPKQLLTSLAGWFAQHQFGKITYYFIKGFCQYYRVNMAEAAQSDLTTYKTFNAFFTRALAEKSRPIDPTKNTIISSADGIVSQFGQIENNELLQAKGHHYSLDSLLAANPVLTSLFAQGQFITTYLSPRDYHRVHMPYTGTLREMIYVPGSLFSVGQLTTQHISNLFARNERVICLFDTAIGPMVQILVGATIVGSIETVWHGVVTPPRNGIIQRWTYPALGQEQAITLNKGSEMGRFQLGSTVINLFVAGQIKFVVELNSMKPIKMGETLATTQ